MGNYREVRWQGVNGIRAGGLSLRMGGFHRVLAIRDFSFLREKQERWVASESNQKTKFREIMGWVRKWAWENCGCVNCVFEFPYNSPILHLPETSLAFRFRCVQITSLRWALLVFVLVWWFAAKTSGFRCGFFRFRWAFFAWTMPLKGERIVCLFLFTWDFLSK